MDYGEDRRADVNSSMISAIGTKGDWLIVWFSNNTAYRYRDAAHKYDQLVSSESVGKTFHQEVRNSFSCEKLKDFWPDSE